MVSEKIEELMRKNPKMEMSAESLKRDLPNKMRLSRRDVVNVMRELEHGGVLQIKNGKVTRKHV